VFKAILSTRFSPFLFIVGIVVAVTLILTQTKPVSSQNVGVTLGATFAEEEDGLRVVFVVLGGPANVLDVKPRDLIRSVDGTKITTLESLDDFLATKNPGDTISIIISRDGVDAGERIITLKSVDEVHLLSVEGNIQYLFSPTDVTFTVNYELKNLNGRDLGIKLHPVDLQYSLMPNVDATGSVESNTRIRPDQDVFTGQSKFVIPYSQFGSAIDSYSLVFIVYEGEANPDGIVIDVIEVRKRIANSVGQMPIIPPNVIAFSAHPNDPTHQFEVVDFKETSLDANSVTLTIDGQLKNYAESEQCFEPSSFMIIRTSDGTQNSDTNPPPVLALLSTGTQESRVCVPSRGKTDIQLQYTIPKNQLMLELKFGLPQNNDLSSVALIWLGRDENNILTNPALLVLNGELRVGLDRQNATDERYLDEILYVGSNQIEVTTLETFLDAVRVTINTCGTSGGEVSATSSYSQTISSKFSMDVESRISAGINPLIFLGGLVNVEGFVRTELQKEEGRELTYQFSYTVTTESDVIEEYDLLWYLVKIKGNVQVQVGDQTYTIPYSLDNRLRGEYRYVGTKPCNQ